MGDPEMDINWLLAPVPAYVQKGGLNIGFIYDQHLS
jgi:hypothetical protein